MKVSESVSGGQGVRQGCAWNFESCSEAQVKLHTVRLGPGGWRLQEDEYHETRTRWRSAINESNAPFSSRTMWMTVDSNASEQPVRSSGEHSVSPEQHTGQMRELIQRRQSGLSDAAKLRSARRSGWKGTTRTQSAHISASLQPLTAVMPKRAPRHNSCQSMKNGGDDHRRDIKQLA